MEQRLGSDDVTATKSGRGLSRGASSLRDWMDRRGVPVAFAASLAVTIAMAILRPIPHGHSYGLAIEVTAVLAVAWFVRRHRPHWVDSQLLLWPLFLLGLYFALERPLNLNPQSEIVTVYRDVFASLRDGRNPYDCACITHFDEYGEHKLGNFNYPPAEIWPYWLAAKLAGTWNWIVLAGSLCVLHLVACAVLFRTFPNARWWTLVAFFPVLVFFELRTNVAQTLLVVAVLVYVLEQRARAERPWHRPAIWVLFGIGLVAKFLIIPIFAAYIWNRVDLARPRTFVQAAIDTIVPVLVAVAMMASFGVGQVFRETVLFNLFLKTRAALTTFYPNVLSGPMTWIDTPGAYSVLAVLFLGASVLAAKWLRPLDAMLCSSTVFLLVSPTPEPQYIPVMIYLALAALLSHRTASEPAITAELQPAVT